MLKFRVEALKQVPQVKGQEREALTLQLVLRVHRNHALIADHLEGFDSGFHIVFVWRQRHPRQAERGGLSGHRGKLGWQGREAAGAISQHFRIAEIDVEHRDLEIDRRAFVGWKPWETKKGGILTERIDTRDILNAFSENEFGFQIRDDFFRCDSNDVTEERLKSHIYASNFYVKVLIIFKT